MFSQNPVKMLRLFCLYNSQRSKLFQSLAMGYSHILTRASSSATTTTTTTMRSQSTSVRIEPVREIVDPDPDIGYKTPPALLNIARQAQELLGTDRFSVDLSMSNNFGDYRDIVTLFLFKVAHIDHPLLHVTKILEAEPSQSLSEKGNANNPYILWRAMMVLLATEKFGYTKSMMEAPLEKQRIMLDRHKRTVKIVEIAHLTQQIHKRIVDVSANQDQNANLTKAEKLELIENLHKANKAAALIGDLLWTQKCIHMAALNCQPATGLICQFLSEYCESEFVFGINTVKHEQFTHDAWMKKSQLGIGSLMGNSMSIMLLFAGHEDEVMRNRGYQLGSLLGRTYQAYDDIRYFNRNELVNPEWLDVGLLPVVYKIQSDPSLLNAPHKEVFQKVKEDQANMARAKDTLHILQEETLQYLTSLQPYEASSEAGDLLTRFVQSLQV